MSPGINDPDTKSPEISPGINNQEMVLPNRMEISPGIKNQEMVLPDRMEISTGIKDQEMEFPDRMETTTPMTEPMKHTMKDLE